MNSLLTFKSKVIPVISGSLLLMLSCTEAPADKNITALKFPDKPDPKGYVCYRATSSISPDGILNEKSWDNVPWTDYFGDIEGSAKPVPRFSTRAKMLWDDSNLYIAAELEEPQVWAYLKERDTIILYDNDFEVFIDPDGDTQAYYELEVNALGTAWDLLLIRAYRDGGPPVNGWDIAGLKVGTHVDGTINIPTDTDKGWTVEIQMPLKALKECAGPAGLPKAGDKWRINFSRVEWRTIFEEGRYKKEINPATGRSFPEDNWVWSPQGPVNMHMPEMWGFLQFSSIEAGNGSEAFIPDPDLNLKWALRMIYYAEDRYFLANKTYTTNLKDLGLKISDFPGNLPAPVIGSTRSAFEAFFPSGGTAHWTIYQDGRLIKK